MDRKTSKTAPGRQTGGATDISAVELFCGIGGFRIACDALGVRTLLANDNKVEACKVYRDQFGNVELIEGDVNEIRDHVPPHDLLTGGFPCQPFSQAGKKEGIRDPRGTLFSAIVEVLDAKRPKYFVLENVKRLLSMEEGEHFATILSALSELDYLIEWRLLNAMHFGIPQNRQRTFIVGHRLDSPFSNGACLSDIRLLGAAEYLALPSAVDALLPNPTDWMPFASHGRRFPEWGIAYHGKFLAHSMPDFAEKIEPRQVKDVLESDVGSEFDLTESTRVRLRNSEVVNRFVQGVEILSNQSGGARMGYTVFGIEGVAPTLTASTSRHYERYRIGNRYRRLTPNEYARIQGFPDHHCKVVTPYTQYELYGNAVPPAMAHWVVQRIIGEAPCLSVRERARVQADLFSNAAAV